MNNTDTFINRRLARERIEREGAETVSADPTMRHTCPRCDGTCYTHKGTKLAFAMTLDEFERRAGEYLDSIEADSNDSGRWLVSAYIAWERNQQREGGAG